MFFKVDKTRLAVNAVSPAAGKLPEEGYVKFPATLQIHIIQCWAAVTCDVKPIRECCGRDTKRPQRRDAASQPTAFLN